MIYEGVMFNPQDSFLTTFFSHFNAVVQDPRNSVIPSAGTLLPLTMLNSSFSVDPSMDHFPFPAQQLCIPTALP